MLKRSRVAMFLVCASVAGAGVALPAAATAASSVTVTAGKPSEYKFSLSSSSVKAGTVTFKVTNKGKIPPDLSIGGKTTPLLKSGKSASITVTLKKGSAAYLCKVPGHAAAGMKGKLKVT
jgi:uncharacterized cupredoxin-like copper-binding protein